MKRQEVPCETCLGTGKRCVFIHEGQANLPLSVLEKAQEMFQNVIVEAKFDNDGFAIRVDLKGTYETMIERQNKFHQWLSKNYPAEVWQNIVLSINRIEVADTLSEQALGKEVKNENT